MADERGEDGRDEAEEDGGETTGASAAATTTTTTTTRRVESSKKRRSERKARRFRSPKANEDRDTSRRAKWTSFSIRHGWSGYDGYARRK